MLIYILIFTFLTLLMLFSYMFKLSEDIKKVLSSILLFFFVCFVGLRHNVGGDWYPYLYHFINLDTNFSDFFNTLLSWDPGYVLIEYFAKWLDIGIYGVNTICAAIFFLGFSYFIRSFNLDPFLSYFIAFPYLIMVVANGYTRQSVALGLIMAMVGAFYQTKTHRIIAFLIGAILFHKTSIIAGIIFFSRIKLANIIKYSTILTLTSIAVYKIYEDKFTHLLIYFFLEKMQSSGGFVRGLVNLSAALLFVLLYKKWKVYYDDYYIWRTFALMTVFIFTFMLLMDTTTLGDRLLLYFYPLQIVIFSRTLILLKNFYIKHVYFIALTLLYWSILLVWLNFAIHRDSWIPYDNLIFKVF